MTTRGRTQDLAVQHLNETLKMHYYCVNDLLGIETLSTSQCRSIDKRHLRISLLDINSLMSERLLPF